MSLRLIPLSILIFWPWVVMSFPDMIRHGYVSCASCHATSTGGGLLTGYGRSLSKELISTWGRSGEEEIGHGLFGPLGEKLQESGGLVGGDVRYLNYGREDDRVRSREGFLMQAQLRLGYQKDGILVALAAGKIENPRTSSEVKWDATEYFAQVALSTELSIRAGRYEPGFGLKLPDHNLWIKSELGLAPWIERDTVGLLHEGEQNEVALFGFQALSSTVPNAQATGYTGTVSRVIGDRARLGFSALNAEGQGRRQRAISMFGTIGWSEKFYTLFEGTRGSANGLEKDLLFARTGYELSKGFVPFMQLQARRLRATEDGDSTEIAAGFQWLPRPHFEVFTTIARRSQPSGKAIEGQILFHYYL